MKLNYFTFLGLFALFMAINTQAAKPTNWPSEFLKVDIEYTKGNYSKALKKSNALISKIEKTENNPFLLAKVAFQKAKIYEGLGDLNSFKSNIEKGKSILNSSNKEKDNNYLLALLEQSEAFIQFSDYKSAFEIIQQAELLVKDSQKFDPLIINQVKLKLSHTYFHLGFYNKSQTFIPSLRRYYISRIVKKERYLDPKSNIEKYRNLNRKEISSRKREYAMLLNFTGQISIQNGNYPKADSILEYNSNFIRKDLRRKDISFAENLYLKGILHQERDEHNDAYYNFSKALKIAASAAEIQYSSTSKNGMRLHKKAIVAARLAEKNKEGKKIRDVFTSKMKRFYKKENYHYSNVLIPDAARNLINQDHDKAEDKLKRIINNPHVPENHFVRIEALEILYNIYIKEDRFEKAQSTLEEISKIKKAFCGDSTPEYHLSLLDQAAFQIAYSNDLKTPEKIFKESLEGIVEKEMDHMSPKYIHHVFQEVKLYELKDQFQKAQNKLTEALKEAKIQYGEDNVNYAIILEKQANIDIDLGKYSDAARNLSYALATFKKEKGGDVNFNPDYAHCMESLARLYIIQGKYEEAESTLKKAYKLSRKSGKDDALRISSTIEELATLYIHTGKYQETEKKLKESIDIKVKKLGSISRTLITPLNQLSQLYLLTGDYTEAEKNARRASLICYETFGDSSVRYAESLKLLQNILSAIGDMEKAEEAGSMALEILTLQFGKNHIYVANALNELALVKLLNNKKPEEIEGMFKEALKIINQNLGDKNPQYAEVLKNAAFFYLEKNKLNEAEKMLEKANTIWVDKLGKENIHSAEILYLKGSIAHAKGEFARAKDFFIGSKNTYANLFDINHPKYVKALSKSAQMSFILGENKAAIKSFEEVTTNYSLFIKKYFPSLSERGKTQFWNLIKTDFEFYNSMAVKLSKENPDLLGNMYNYALNTKGLLLNSSIKIKEKILNSNNAHLIKKFQEWILKKETLTRAISMSLEQRKANEIDLKILEKEIETLEKELSSSSELFAQESNKRVDITWQKVQESLRENEVAVELIRYRHFNSAFTDTIHYAALIITAKTKNNPELVLLKNGKDLESKFLKFYRNSIKFKGEDNYSYKVFWEPLKQFIKEGTTVYLSSDGVFNQINLETIKTPEGGFVLDQNEMVLLGNTKELIDANKNKRKKKDKKALESNNSIATLVGNPTYYLKKSSSEATIVPLPGAEKEVKSLFSLIKDSQWNSEVYLNERATEENVKALQSPKIFHIATHGFFLQDDKQSKDEFDELNEIKAAQNPLLRSGLLLANGGSLIESNNVYRFNSQEGILTAYEAMNLNFDKTELVVLSACETALGEVQVGEGVYGLQRAFLVAGAKNIIMSLFKVSDEVTQELMISFFKKWLETGDKRQSFLEAKKEIKQKYPDPINWGSFVMIGLD